MTACLILRLFQVQVTWTRLSAVSAMVEAWQDSKGARSKMNSLLTRKIPRALRRTGPLY
jgi:hypothetical protein